jgi:methionine-rich copper-binding protein CopC
MRTRTLLVSLLALPGAPACYAHAELEQAEPPQRSQLTSAPKVVRLQFNEAVEASYSTLGVENSTGEPLGHAKLTAPDPQTLQLRLPALGAGEYSVHYRVLSVDGHVVDGSYNFSVKAPANPP